MTRASGDQAVFERQAAIDLLAPQRLGDLRLGRSGAALRDGLQNLRAAPVGDCGRRIGRVIVNDDEFMRNMRRLLNGIKTTR